MYSVLRARIAAFAVAVAFVPPAAASGPAAIQAQDTLRMTGTSSNSSLVAVQAAGTLVMTGAGVDARDPPTIAVQAGTVLQMTGIGTSSSITAVQAAGTLVMTGSK